MFKGLNKDLLDQARQMQTRLSSLQEELARKEVQASSGGGMVTATANGQGRIVGVRIDPEVVDREAKEVLEELVLAAVNEALNKSREMAGEEMRKLTGGLDLPGLGG